MDLTQLMTSAGALASSAVAVVQHNGILMSGISFGGGLAAANYALIIQKIVQSKWVTAAIQKDPKLAKEIVAELQKDVDAVADAPVLAPGAQTPKA